MTLEKLSEKSGISVSYLYRLETGDRNLSVKNINKLAGPLGANPSELISVAATQHRIRLIGEIRAGHWQPANEADDFHGEYFDLPLPEIYQTLRPYALKVIGPSMNLVYPEGTILICCHLAELHEEPLQGKRYIIQDIDPHNGIETTVKELVIDESGRPWAWPRSSNPMFQEPIALDRARNGHEIIIKARVVFALRPE